MDLIEQNLLKNRTIKILMIGDWYLFFFISIDFRIILRRNLNLNFCILFSRVEKQSWKDHIFAEIHVKQFII
jgi:hypothetical protein